MEETCGTLVGVAVPPKMPTQRRMTFSVIS
jgi:hypothetical protein